MDKTILSKTFNERLEIQKAIWLDNRWLYLLVGFLLGGLLGATIELLTRNLNSLLVNLVPEAIGMLVTVLIINRIVENNRLKMLRDELYSNLHSRSNDTVLNALQRIRQ
ncbi:MAG: hypothetical protein AAFN11_06360, partial [Chloroflexota bacterium]